MTGRAEMMDAPHVGGLGGTYGGNPVACAAAIAALDAFEFGGLVERARSIESVIRDHIEPVAAADPRLGEIRGRGAMIAMEFVDPVTGEPDAALTGQIAKACHAQGVIVLTCGTYGNIVRLLPPLTISDELLIEGLTVLTEALAAA